MDCFTGNCDTEVEYRSFWGGDILGLIQKLDYLKDLGIGAVWLTPMYEGVRDYGTGIGYGTDYHGYWVINYDRVNPHFGTWDQVRQLGKALHEHGMRYIQDITLNDSNANDVHVFGRLYYGVKTERVLIKSYADDFDSSTGLRFYKHFDNDPRCVQARKLPDRQQTDWQLHHCSLFDLSGYNQRDERIAHYLIDAGKLWLTNGVDDFRLDSVKYPFPDFIASFTQGMIKKSRQLKRGAPYIVGEWSAGGAGGDPKSLAFANRYDIYHTNLLDFQLAIHLNQYIGGAVEDLLVAHDVAFGALEVGTEGAEGAAIDADVRRVEVRVDVVIGVVAVPALADEVGQLAQGEQVGLLLKGQAVTTTLAILLALVVGALIIAFSDTTVLHEWSTFFSNPGAAISAAWDSIAAAYSALFEGAIFNPHTVEAAFHGGSVGAIFYPLSQTASQATPRPSG